MWRINLRVLAVSFLVVGFYTLVAHAIPQIQSEVPETLALGANATPEALAAAGERIYNGAGGCTACHGLGTRAPNLLTDHAGQGSIGARCGSRKPGMECKAYLYESMTQPGAFVVPGFENIMLNMRRTMDEAQIWATVAFLQSQGGEITVTGADIPASAPPPAGGTAPAGGGGPAMSATTDPRQLLTEKGCVGCHSIDGTGPPVVLAPSFDGIGGRINADRIRRGILDPNAEVAQGFTAGMMPPTFGSMLTAAQLEAIVRFLEARK
jgi:mono/diheme cytochrome c family protein